ncbi:hypothetical protein GCM10011410_20900 [Hoyosella rhizosphaerae]|uniref:Uncharacterized protein n=1 Tax=Hoyosella rhizosphaerae TaxID=1755582 RepID=A0A916UBY9_9ACTN|nr:hypothetical protein GCM10011410_20900 [Hoyosella rhizosphaerae]
MRLSFAYEAVTSVKRDSKPIVGCVGGDVNRSFRCEGKYRKRIRSMIPVRHKQDSRGVGHYCAGAIGVRHSDNINKIARSEELRDAGVRESHWDCTTTLGLGDVVDDVRCQEPTFGENFALADWCDDSFADGLVYVVECSHRQDTEIRGVNSDVGFRDESASIKISDSDEHIRCP